ncbi:hypothetical protein [Photorhabdus hainanensis]|nr:hypothetical protein [Photorhabdus hainanensis]
MIIQERDLDAYVVGPEVAIHVDGVIDVSVYADGIVGEESD